MYNIERLTELNPPSAGLVVRRGIPSERRTRGSHWHTDLDEGINRHDGHVGLGFGVIHQVEVDKFLQFRVARLHTVNDVREEGAANNKREKARCSPSRISINKPTTGILFLSELCFVHQLLWTVTVVILFSWTNVLFDFNSAFLFHPVFSFFFLD